VNEQQLRALVEAADAGVDCDGLRVAAQVAKGGEEAGEERYAFETPDNSLRGLSESELRALAAENPWFVSNWHYWERVDRPAMETAFLRWLEDADDRGVRERYETLADGFDASWGQLRIAVSLGEDGRRLYTVVHEDDADPEATESDDVSGGGDAGVEGAVDGLAVYTDPLDAREPVKHDDRGRYRPLKTAPTLPTGWAFVDLDGRSLVRLVDVVYPATVANWHRERERELDVSHWHETVQRQSGIYGLVETWDRGEGHEHVNWVAEACCADSQCLKRREWQYDEGTDLDVDGGDGAFPCREPCSLVISAARTWTRLEAEEPRSYEFELTPSEKEQLEEILDAVADGRVDEIREADFSEGANRWRARFLRAKRMDEDGDLGGVPTDREE
jgi:hypothetical protein